MKNVGCVPSAIVRKSLIKRADTVHVVVFLIRKQRNVPSWTQQTKRRRKGYGSTTMTDAYSMVAKSRSSRSSSIKTAPLVLKHFFFWNARAVVGHKGSIATRISFPCFCWLQIESILLTTATFLCVFERHLALINVNVESSPRWDALRDECGIRLCRLTPE